MLNVLASVSGLSLKPISILFFIDLAIFSIVINSLLDSVLINKIFFLIANFNSSSVFPTPEKTIFFGLIPALKTLFNSPIETTSAPKPKLLIIFKILILLLDLTEKHVRGSILLNCFLKLKIFSLIFLYE